MTSATARQCYVTVDFQRGDSTRRIQFSFATQLRDLFEIAVDQKIPIEVDPTNAHPKKNRSLFRPIAVTKVEGHSALGLLNSCVFSQSIQMTLVSSPLANTLTACRSASQSLMCCWSSCTTRSPMWRCSCCISGSNLLSPPSTRPFFVSFLCLAV